MRLDVAAARQPRGQPPGGHRRHGGRRGRAGRPPEGRRTSRRSAFGTQVSASGFSAPGRGRRRRRAATRPRPSTSSTTAACGGRPGRTGGRGGWSRPRGRRTGSRRQSRWWPSRRRRARATTRSRTSAGSLSSGTTTSATATARVPTRSPDASTTSTAQRRADAEPGVGRVVEGPRGVGGVDVDQSEAAADHRAEATSLTGRPPGWSTGNRTRTSRSDTSWSRNRVVSSTRSSPSTRV